MKTRFILIFLVLVLLAPQAFAVAPAGQPAPDGYELKDFSRGFLWKVPNSNWNVNASKYHVSFSDLSQLGAVVMLKKSWYTVKTAEEAYKKRKDNLKNYLPGAEVIKDAESVTIAGGGGIAMTYKDPGQKKIHREILFMHKGRLYELKLTVKEDNLEKVKDDFAQIIKGIKTLR